MKQRFQEWLANTHGRRFELLRHFLSRFFDGEDGSPPGEAVKVYAGIAAALLSLGLLEIKRYVERYNVLHSPDFSNPLMYRQGVREDLVAFFALAMAGTALLAILRWRALFPTASDCLALAGLPVSARQVFTAKFAAVLLMFAVFVFSVGAVPSLLFAFVTAGPWQENHSALANVAAGFTAVAGACASVFFTLIAVQGILLNVLPARIFTRASLFVQGCVFTAVLGAVPLVDRQPAASPWWPPGWFVRLWETIAASAPSSAAVPAVLAVAGPAILAVLAYGLSYGRYQAILLSAPSARARGHWPAVSAWLLERWASDPREQAAFAFIWKTLARSSRHRLILLTYAGLAAAAITKGALDMPRPSLRDQGIYGTLIVLAPLATALLITNGLKYLFSIPESLSANWTFQIVERQGRTAWLRASERFVVWCAIVPVFIVAAPAALAVFHPLRAAAVLALNISAALNWFEIVYRRWDLLPFTCSYTPGKRPVVLIVLRYVYAMPLLAAVGQLILHGSSEIPSFVAIFTLELALLYRLRRKRRSHWPATPVRFEDAPVVDVVPLHLPPADAAPEPEDAAAIPPPELFSGGLVASRGWLPQEWVEEIREERRQPSVLLATLLEDVRYGFRLIRRTPILSAVVILTLTIGIGVNATVFTIVNGLALRPHVNSDPDRFVRIIAKTQFQDSPRAISYGEYLNWRDGSATVRQLAAWGDFMALIGDEDASGSLGLLVSCDFFGLDGNDRPLAGRLFTAGDCDSTGQVPAVVLSESVWRSRYAADPHIAGRLERMNGRTVTIVGVAPDGAGGWTIPRPKVWVPFTAQPYFNPGEDYFVNRESLWLWVAGRLAPGVSRSEAEAELNLLARRHDAVRRGRRTVVVTTDGSWAQELEQNVSGRRLMLIGFFFGAFNLVLLISCANVSTLLLSRAAARRREIAVRLALGAARVRIVRMLVTESTVLAAFAGFASLLLIRHSPEPLYRYVAGRAPEFPLTPDWRIFLYISAVVLLTGFASGLAPALESLKVDLTASLKGTGSLSRGGPRADRIRGALVAAQVAMSMVLLVEAGLFAQSEDQTLRRDPGYSPRSVVVAPLLFPDGATAETRRVRLRSIRNRVEALPGVRSVAFSENIPLWAPETVEVRPPSRQDALQPVDLYSASPGFFNTLRIRILKGREFTDTDTSEIVVSRTLAALFWPRADPVGRELVLPGGSATVIGVAADIEPMRFGGSDNPVAYRLRRDSSEHAVMSVRFDGGAAQGALAVRNALHASHPGVFLIARVLQDWIEQVTATLWNVVSFIVLLGVVATVLATSGIYAAVSFAVAQRTRDIGIRLALGATRMHIVRDVVLSGGRPVVEGLTVGLWLSLAAAAGLRQSVAGTPLRLDTTAPLMYCAAALALLAAAAAAIVGPARRGAKCNPCDALRCE